MLAQGSRTSKAMFPRYAHCPALDKLLGGASPRAVPSLVHLSAVCYSVFFDMVHSTDAGKARLVLEDCVNLTFLLQPPSLTGSPPILAGFCTLCVQTCREGLYTQGLWVVIYTLCIYISIYIFYIHIYI